MTGEARPLEILRSVQRDRRFAEIEHLLTSWQPDKVIVGLPLASDGAEQYARLRCRRFANQLRGRFGVQVELVDERGSSKEAQQMLGTNAGAEDVAAMGIRQR